MSEERDLRKRKGTEKGLSYTLEIKAKNVDSLFKRLKKECELIRAEDAMRIHSTLLNKGVEWVFNPPAASHFGGAWERMIRSVRKIMISLMHEQSVKLDDEGLCTRFCEVEAILNSRPITEVSPHPNDVTPLTPNQLLYSRSGETIPPGVFEKSDQYCRRRWRQVQYLADIFWKRWVKEYLPTLQRRQKWISKRRNLVIGDIVLLMDSTPRNAWCLGRVTDTISDKKGFIRVPKVKTATTELVRPVDKLCLIVASTDE